MFESKINRGRANGYAPLDGSGKVPLDKLPPIQSTINTGSFATTGSNTFTDNQIISGSGDSSLTIGEVNTIAGSSFGLRVSGSDGAPLFVTSDGTLLIGAITNPTNISDDASFFANQLISFPISDGPTAGILVQKSGSFQSNWVFDYDGKSYFPSDITIGYNSLGSGLTSGSLNITKGNINVSGSLYFGSGSVISEASNSISITPTGAGVGQSLVIRPTLSTWATTSSAFIVYGEPITVAIISVPNRDYNGNYFGTLNYEISGSGVTQQSLGRPLTGSFVFNPGNSEKSITWTIPANSTISEFTLTIVSLDGTYTGYESGETDPALYYNFEENGLPIGQYITVTNNGIFNSEHSHIHLVSGNPSLVDIYLGDDDQYVKIEKNAGDVVVGTNLDTHHWRFDKSGSLILPNDMVIDASVDFGILQIGGDGTYIRIDDGGAPPALTIATNGGENEWYFGLDGNLTTPGDIVLSGSFAQQVNYAPLGSGSFEETPATEVTELDITKDIHLIDITDIEGNSHYYLPNGLYDGQVVRLALKGDDIASPNNVYVWVESLRTDTGAGTQFVDWLPFFNDTPRSLATTVWIDGSWNIDNSHFGMW
jgi:hypothetical protein